MSKMSIDAEKIKMSLCYRAKYRVTKHILYPLTVVPHPRCWGEPVDSLRTKQLTKTIIGDGYDSIKANENLVAVEEDPRWRGYFQSNFGFLVTSDPDMAEQGSGISPTFGSLSNSSLNCLMRNILCASKGCICVSEDKVCACKNAPILDENGNYSAVRLHSYDEAWALDCSYGLGWEILSYRMGIEEPQAAAIISHTLHDKRSKQAMETAHIEIMSTLISLCTPDIQRRHGDLHFKIVRDKMRGMFGAAVDNEHFSYFFALVRDAEAVDSAHMQDLKHFTSAYVNEKFRKICMKVYGVVAQYPRQFPRIKNACIKWSWKAGNTQIGSCYFPPGIKTLLDAHNCLNMYNFMLSLEAAMSNLHTLASTVVEDIDLKTRWVAEADIGLMSKFFQCRNRW